MEMFSPPTGPQLRDAGIKIAVTHADDVSEGWQLKAYQCLEKFLLYSSGAYQFQTEDFRQYALEDGLPVPPSLRAFGGIVLKAAREGLIKKVGIEKVRNPKAHCANATVWMKA